MTLPMLNTKVLVTILDKITATEGVDDAVILSNSGEVLAYSGNDEKKFVDVVSAITNNMWLVLQNSGEAALNEDYLDYVLIQCTEGKTIIRKMADFLLCIRARGCIGSGLLKKKSQILKEYFEQPLKEVGYS
ncbi:ragulator complex protein LAMTOR2 [Planococcus citri]|uniref:ragulator complex protein LAMTOR2 n=1 Tax=Planococcus citri TaxID=170843 RepID=UPI0031F9A875